MLDRLRIFAVPSVCLAFALFAMPVSGEEIPNGVLDGPDGIPYGTYTSAMQESARPLQEKLLEVERKAHGLALMSDRDLLTQAKAVYELEHRVIQLHLEVANTDLQILSPFERKALLYFSAHVYRDIRHHAERLYENMVRYADLKMPQSNGGQLRTEISHGTDSIYEPNFRSGKELSEREKADAYEKKVKDFLESGGNWKEIVRLDADFYKKMGAFTKLEYVLLARGGTIMVTTGKAGHLLLAKGRPVRAAGQIVFLKNLKGQVTLAIVTNASGNYKPDLLSAQQVANRLQRELNLSPEMIVVTKGEPLSTQIAKILMKVDGLPKAEAERQLKDLETKGTEILHGKEKYPVWACGGVFL